MSKADKMFEELGFEKWDNPSPINYNRVYYKKYREIDNLTTTIVFDLSDQRYWKYHDKRDFMVVFDTHQHLAIHEKIKELGWFDWL